MNRPWPALILIGAFVWAGCDRTSGVPVDGGVAVDSGALRELRQCGTVGETTRWREQGDDFLSGCEEFLGSLTFADTPLEDLSMLEGLVVIRGALSLFRNPAMTSLDGTDRLERLGGLSIRFSPLAEVRGFSSLREVDGALIIDSNSALDAMPGLSSVERAGGLVLSNLPGLTRLDDLRALRHVAGDVSISGLGMTRQDANRFLRSIRVDGRVDLDL